MSDIDRDTLRREARDIRRAYITEYTYTKWEDSGFVSPVMKDKHRAWQNEALAEFRSLYPTLSSLCAGDK